MGMITRYFLDGTGIESRDFPHPSWPGQRPTQSPVQWLSYLFHRKEKRPRRGVDYTPLSSDEFKERV